ncbi:MAG: hypothetical protein HS115_05335 [Spirochaetales bacterium]|nr:hypothetical protein [Spirochaetales bacterium]
MPVASSRRILWALVATSVLLVVVLFFVLTSGNEGDDALSQESLLRELESEVDRSGGLNFLKLERMMRGGWEPGRENLKAHVRLYYRYPDLSRPLNDDMPHLLDPYRVVQPPRPLYQKAKPDESDEPLFFIHEEVPRNIVVGEPFLCHLSVRDRQNTAVPFEIVSARVLSDSGTGRVALDEPRYNDDGRDGDRKAGDMVYVMSWQAIAPTRLAWGELTLSLELKAGEQVFKHEIPFHSTPEMVGRFTGRFREAIEDGSLVIYAEVDITRAGFYQLAANLIHLESGQASHVAFHYGNLAAGVQNIPFLFFGKIFHDKNRQGRFVLRYPRGKRHNLPDRGPWAGADKLKHREAAPVVAGKEPPASWLLPYAGEYITASYTLDAFSDKEYEGEDKESALQAAESER